MPRPLGSKVAALSAFEVTICICQITTQTSAKMIPTPLVSLKSWGRMALAQNFPPTLLSYWDQKANDHDAEAHSCDAGKEILLDSVHHCPNLYVGAENHHHHESQHAHSDTRSNSSQLLTFLCSTAEHLVSSPKLE